MKKSSALLATLLVSTAAISAPDEEVVKDVLRNSKGISADVIRRHYQSCDSGNTFYMKICAAYRLSNENIRLNEMYVRARAEAKAMDAGYEASLVRAQRAWIVYRDRQCIFEGEISAGGGTLEGLQVLGCREELTKAQADRLETGLNR